MTLVKQPEPEWVTGRLSETDLWRFEQLCRAGFPFYDALRIAESDQDLHVACELMARGCSLELALLILA